MQNGVWFTAPSPTGPWTPATSVPPEIYSIPVSSPLHYVTYVYVYDSTPTVVYTGYTPGYLGTCVSTDDTVVYGTGYAYTPVVRQHLGGLSVDVRLQRGVLLRPVLRVRLRFRGLALVPGCCPRPWWGPFDWARRHHDGNYNHVALDHVNIYRHWGNEVAPTLSRFEENHWSAQGWSNLREPFNPYSARNVTEGGRNWEANAHPRIVTNQPIHVPEMHAVLAPETHARLPGRDAVEQRLRRPKRRGVPRDAEQELGGAHAEGLGERSPRCRPSGAKRRASVASKPRATSALSASATGSRAAVSPPEALPLPAAVPLPAEVSRPAAAPSGDDRFRVERRRRVGRAQNSTHSSLRIVLRTLSCG